MRTDRNNDPERGGLREQEQESGGSGTDGGQQQGGHDFSGREQGDWRNGYGAYGVSESGAAWDVEEVSRAHGGRDLRSVRVHNPWDEPGLFLGHGPQADSSAESGDERNRPTSEDDEGGR